MMEPRVRARSRSTARGFTLVELMVVVAIVGVLAVAAVAGYRKYVISSRLAEATNMLSGIKQRQEAYRAETGYYLPVSGTLAANQAAPFNTLYPHCLAGLTVPGKEKVAWGLPGTCPNACCPGGTGASFWSRAAPRPSSATRPSPARAR